MIGNGVIGAFLAVVKCNAGFFVFCNVTINFWPEVSKTNRCVRSVNA